MSAYARLLFLPDPAYQGQSENDASLEADAPAETEQLRIVLEALARYTRTPDECYFCLWDGWGSDIDGGDGGQAVSRRTGTVRRGPQIAPALPRSVLDGPKVVVPNRAYYLFQLMVLPMHRMARSVHSTH
ncbi:MAG: hypothetical protein ACRDQ7_05385 [Haloechinothrix sp.]